MTFFKKIKISWLIIAAVIILVAYGIYNNPDRKLKNVNSELGQILMDMQTTVQQVRNDITSNQACFGDESLQEGTSAECVVNLRGIQDAFKNTVKNNLTKLEEYYRVNKTNLDEETKNMIENSLLLYKSDSYSDLMKAYDRYFTANIEWHKFFRDVVGIKGPDNMSDEELMQTKTLAQEMLDAEDNLKLKTNAFSDYLHENFDKEFIDNLTSYADKLK